MKKAALKNKASALTLLFAVTYMVSYITRINYGAVISQMVADTGFSKSQLSMALTGSFITYGAGQLVSGVLGDRISPKKLISLGLILTVLMNLCIPFCQNPYQMTAFWCLNGFAQSFLWPPLVRLMSVHLSEEEYKKASTRVSWGSSFGTILIYLLSPLLISLWGWRTVFFFSASAGALMLIFWNRLCQDVAPAPKSPAEGKSKTASGLFTPLVFAIMLAIILQGMLRDGVTTWMPSYISETYHFSHAASILTGVLLPLFGIVCIQAASTLYIKKFTNPLTCAGVFFFLGTIASLALFWSTGKNAAFSVFFSALLTGCMHGINLILICMIPPFFKKQGNVSTVSGVLNSCTYIGSAASTYGIAVLSENRGWSFTLLVWTLLALAGALVCMACARPWRKKFL